MEPSHWVADRFTWHQEAVSGSQVVRLKHAVAETLPGGAENGNKEAKTGNTWGSERKIIHVRYDKLVCS